MVFVIVVLFVIYFTNESLLNAGGMYHGVFKLQ